MQFLPDLFIQENPQRRLGIRLTDVLLFDRLNYRRKPVANDGEIDKAKKKSFVVDRAAKVLFASM